MKDDKLETQIIELVEKGYDIDKTGTGRFVKISPCPVCNRKNHHFVIDLENNSYFSLVDCCDAGGLYEFVANVQGLYYEEIAEIESEIFLHD